MHPVRVLACPLPNRHADLHQSVWSPIEVWQAQLQSDVPFWHVSDMP
jgi:hypothetical protein